MDSQFTSSFVLQHVRLVVEHEISQINFIIIEQIRSFENSLHLEQLLLTREAYWTAQLFTLNPHGLNKRRESRSKHRINYYN